MAFIDGNLVTGTYSELLFLDSEYKIKKIITHPYISGVHGISVNNNNIWVSSCNNDAILKFNKEGSLIDHYFLGENKALLDYYCLPSTSGSIALPYKEQLFHVNHVQETSGKLLVSLHKQGDIWDLYGDRVVEEGVGKHIHDAQLLSSRFYINDTYNDRVVIMNKNDNEVKIISARIYKYRQMLVNILNRLNYFSDKVCRVNWLRGLCVIDSNHIIVGISPATILIIDINKEVIIDKVVLSKNACEAVFSIIIRNQNNFSN
jgi:hypothetical protein